MFIFIPQSFIKIFVLIYSVKKQNIRIIIKVKKTLTFYLALVYRQNMGNILLDDYKKDDPLESFDKWLQQNPEMTGKEILAQNKLFLTAHFTYSSKSIILKVYFKRDDSLVSDIIKSFQLISSKVYQLKCVNILPLTILNTRQVIDKKQANLIMATRQFLPITLEDKLQRRPYLTLNQKKWIIFQMIMAVDIVHTQMDIYHGNIRTSNFLFTTYQYLLLTDFANYKPTYILQDTQQGLAQFRLFYPSSLQKCNLAPEKLQGRSQSASKIKKPEYLFNLYRQSGADNRQSYRYSMLSFQKDQRSKKQLDTQSIAYFSHMNNLKQMDLFSLGLCILQVLNDGKNTFSYQNLLNLKKNKFVLEDLIENIITNQVQNDPTNQQRRKKQLNQIKEIVTQLLIKKSQKASSLTQKFKDFMKDQVYILLWHCLSAFTKISFQLADHRIYLFQSIIEFIEKQIKSSENKFSMKRAKCFQNFSALKIFGQLIRKKLMYSTQIQSHTLLGQILTSIQKKDNQSGIVESDDEIQIGQKNKRQSFFINQSKKKRISKRLSFVGHTIMRKQKVLCPPKADQYLQSLIEQRNMEIKFSKLSMEQRRKTKLQMYLQRIKNQQNIRNQIKSQKSFFYADYQLIIKIVFSCIRNCRYVASKMLGIQLINIIGRQSRDQTLITVVYPYLINLCQDSDINVAKYAFNSLIDNFYNFIDPFSSEEDIVYYQMIIDFFLNTIKGSKIRIYLFSRFQEIYNICEWLEVAYLKIHTEIQANAQLTRSTTPKFTASQSFAQSSTNNQQSFNEHSSKFTNFYQLVDQLKIYYGTFSMKEIQALMENVPIAILPQMFEFYISFLNTQKIMGLKCSLFIAQNATKQFEMQKYIIDVFDNCMESGLSDTGIALCYGIKYFTIRKNTNIDIVQKITPHIINPHRWVRQQTFSYIKMCLEQFPPAKIFFLFRQIFDAPFPLTVENLSEQILLPEPLREIDVNMKQRKFTSRISRKMGNTQKKFIQYMKIMKLQKQTGHIKQEVYQAWQNQTKKFRFLDQSIASKNQIQNFVSSMRKTIEQLYEYNFFYYGFLLSMKYNPLQKQQGLNSILQNLKKYSKFSLQSSVVSQQQRQFFQNLLATINSNFQKLVSKHSQQITPQKLKLSLCINMIAEQLYMFHQIKVKPTLSLGASNIKINNQRNFKPRGIQVTQIYQNKQTICDLINVGEYFFMSGCHDGTIRLYNMKSIQMNIITESEAIYQLKPQSHDEKQKVKINSLACLQNTFTAVVGTTKGQIKGIQIQRMSGKVDNSRVVRIQNQTQLFKYNVNGDIQKIIIPKGPQFSQCIAYITSQSILGVQDIRCKETSLKCNIGKQRGYCLSLASKDSNSLLVGTVDGYLMTYDMRFNLISSVLQLNKDNQTVPITKIIKLRNQNKFCILYPSSNYQFAQFQLDSAQIRIQPTRLYNGTSYSVKQQDNIPSIPYFQNKTNDQVFKLCNNNIQKHIYYSQLSNFDKNYKILDYVSEPLTLKQSKIRELWANGCRHRYNQILSIYTKKSLPFVEYFPSGILTNFNPNPQTIQSRNQSQSQPRDFAFLVDKRERQSSNLSSRYTASIYETFGSSNLQIQRQVITKNNKIKLSQFDQTENKEYFNHCVVVNGFVAVSNKNSRIKIFK